MISSVKLMRTTSRLRARAGFTLIEIMLAAVITVVLVGILLQITTLASTTVTLSTQKLSAFATARTAFDTITKNLSQATLNTYLDYYDANGLRRTDTNSDINNVGGATFVPVSFGRASDLQFVIQTNQSKSYYGQEVYFQAPRSYSTDASIQSVQGLLNACGYYVQFGDSHLFQPGVVTAAKYRYRLMQGLEPTENLKVFTATAVSGTGSTTDSSSTWLTNIQNGSGKGSIDVTPIADNVIALVAWPRLSVNNDATGYQLLPASHAFSYDSQANVAPSTTSPYYQNATADQLPPDVEVTMVVLDEASMVREEAMVAASAAALPSAQQAAASALPPPDIEADLAGRFTKADNYATDITGLAKALSGKQPSGTGGLNFQIFNTTVALRESKWTTQQQ
jgi:uncharacterized protein (TIGR02599 family)